MVCQHWVLIWLLFADFHLKLVNAVPEFLLLLHEFRVVITPDFKTIIELIMKDLIGVEAIIRIFCYIDLLMILRALFWLQYLLDWHNSWQGQVSQHSELGVADVFEPVEVRLGCLIYNGDV